MPPYAHYLIALFGAALLAGCGNNDADVRADAAPDTALSTEAEVAAADAYDDAEDNGPNEYAVTYEREADTAVLGSLERYDAGDDVADYTPEPK